MSHWTKARTKATDQSLVIKALQKMGYECEVGEFQISAEGTTETAQIKLTDSVGLQKQEDGTWAMIGDPYYTRNTNNPGLYKYYRKEGKFGEDLNTNYAVVQATESLEEQSFELMEETEDEEYITLTFERY